MFGKLIANIVGGVIDTADLGIALINDVVKSPVRLIERAEDPFSGGDDWFQDTKKKIEEIKSNPCD